MDATIATSTNSETEYEVSVGKWYYVTLTFQEGPGHQFPNEGTMRYVLPEGFDIPLISDEGTFSITVTTPDGNVTVKNNHFTVENGEILINWSQDSNVSKLFAANNAKFFVRFKAYFNGDKEEINYNDVVVTPLDFPSEDSKLEMVKKSMPAQFSSIPSVDPTMEYIITLTSTGYNQNIYITDKLSGEGVTLDPNSFVVTSNGSIENYTITPNVQDNSFVFEVDRLLNGQTVTISYNKIHMIK